LPFGNSSQKGGVHIHGDRGRFCRLYLGVSCYVLYFVYFGFDVSLFVWVVYVRGRHYVFCLVFLLFLVSHMVHWLLIYIMRLFMVY